MRGRRPLPTAIKQLRGNPGKRPLNDNEPKPEIERPPCPPELSKVAKKEWHRIVPILVCLGILARIDRSALAAYCQSWARFIEAEEKIAETSLVIKTKSGNIVENPYYSISKRERELMHKFLIEFGMTPASRSRLNIHIPKPASPSRIDRFFKKPQ
jgi:P27 family predicted phage terminase small subunit